MTHRQGQGIGGVIGPGDLSEAQDVPGQLHHLAFFRLAIAHHRLLHLAGGVLINRQALLGNAEQDHPSGMALSLIHI